MQKAAKQKEEELIDTSKLDVISESQYTHVHKLSGTPLYRYC